MSVVVTGYASLDYALRLDRAAAAGSDRDHSLPASGVAPARRLPRLCRVRPRRRRDPGRPARLLGRETTPKAPRTGTALAALGVEPDGIAVLPGRTPVCVLAYQPDGRCHCLYDPGSTAAAELKQPSARVLRRRRRSASRWGRRRRPGTRCASRVPAPRCSGRSRRIRAPFLRISRAALAARADVVVFSRGEAEFAAASFAAAGPVCASPVAHRDARRAKARLTCRTARRASCRPTRSRRTMRPAPATPSWAGCWRRGWRRATRRRRSKPAPRRPFASPVARPQRQGELEQDGIWLRQRTLTLRPWPLSLSLRERESLPLRGKVARSAG